MRNKRSRLSRENKRLAVRLFVQMIGLLVLLPVAAIAIYWIVWFLFTRVQWQGDEWLYQVGVWFSMQVDRLFLLYLFFGTIGIIAYFWSKPFRYLEEVVGATKAAYDAEQEEITGLSAPLRGFEADINQMKRTMERNERAARDAEQRKNDLVVYLAHDLKTPLTSVIGYLTLLRDERQISEELRQKYLAISLDKAERLEDLINEFFEITRFNLSSLTLEPARVNLTRMLEQLIFEFRPMLAEKNLDCRLTAAPDIQWQMDVDKMERVFDNMLRNAVNYSFPDTTIEIGVLRDAEALTITFLNQGNPIPQEKLERIFEQFFRLDSARISKSGGAGLGLAIAKEIVQLHGGKITAESREEQVKFTIVLPVGKS